MFGHHAHWTEKAAAEREAALDRAVLRPVEIDDVDEPLDAVTGIAFGVIGGLAIWLLLTFLLIWLF